MNIEKSKTPHPKSQLLTKTHEKGFEQIEEAFSELEKEFTNEDKTTNQER